ncbi:hypothetical protein ACO34A_23940 (plasmid) [Rhizobium sp. ACO-34A]|nr:hypothetical protein ACO34A_23940 [Rhizobium sp. ACO-34A]
MIGLRCQRVLLKMLLKKLVIDVFALLHDATIPPRADCAEGDFKRGGFPIRDFRQDCYRAGLVTVRAQKEIQVLFLNAACGIGRAKALRSKNMFLLTVRFEIS